MATIKIRGKELKKLGFAQGPVIGLLIGLAKKNLKHSNKEDILTLFSALLAEPERFIEHDFLAPAAALLIPSEESGPIPLKSEKTAYQVFGEQGIGLNAREQMDVAMQLPVAEAGALMPDAHHGYGLPIGGVLATENAIIPYGVGVDIGCRMALSIYEMQSSYIDDKEKELKEFLKEHSRFGRNEFSDPMDDPVLDREEFHTIPFLRNLKDKARRQIGSSGSGNHFVEFGMVQVNDLENEFQLPPGQYMGLLTHSGSRGLGATIARHYTNLAIEKCPLPKIAKHLAWLDLNTAEGMEYWLAMNLAGDYASANHRHIHLRMSRALGAQPLACIENHHNFAWKEKLPDGRMGIVHRKGATPAQKGVLGIIPGSMTATGYIVRGRGAPKSLHSASHGAGRQMSRTKARNSITKQTLKKYLKDHNVSLIGGGLDEAPMAYKDINQVMQHQADLVDIVGTFRPRIVRMDS
ncbi:MAG: RtcB family protein [Bacteroidota bacterium]